MIRLSRPLAVLSLLVWLGPAGAAPAPEAAAKPLIITHVTVIDTAGGPSQPDMAVVVEGGRIRDLGKADRVPVPEGARVVDGTGKFLIPGLWDMHVHLAGPSYLPLFVANGVTGVREMHAFFPDLIFHYRRQARDGTLVGPRIVAAGAMVDGPKPFWPGAYAAADADEGRKAVQALKKRGADFVKVYTKLPRPAFLAIVDEARHQGLPVAGHVPESVSAAEASDLGMRSMEHLYGIGLACSADEEKLRAEEVEALARVDNAALGRLVRRTAIKALDSYREDKARALFARFVKNGTWQVPTLTVLHSLASLDDETFTHDPRLKYVPSYLRTFLDPASGKAKFTPEALANEKLIYRKTCELVKAMHRSGVPILAGTDTTNPYCFPGFSLHDELALLVEQGGFTPLEALQAATRDPARFLDLEKELGTVEKGKAADLVLLDADPLRDIKNTQKIAAVVLGGKLLDRPELDRMLAEAEGTGKR
jgi:imidazolonepropionase-like amidohydrolase